MTLLVTHAIGAVSLQDLGRTGHMHEGVPPGGAMVPAHMIAANRRVGNRDDAVVLEIAGEVIVSTQTPIEIATQESTMTLRPGQETGIRHSGWNYLAVRGGFAAPCVLGGRGALPGERIRKGDQLALAHEPRVEMPVPGFFVAEPVRVTPGPDLDAFAKHALDVLCGTGYRVWRWDRSGATYRGPAIVRDPAYREHTRPMVRGAIEVPPDGQPIVLGPDHPTTGGYPVIAVVAAEDLDRVFAFPFARFYVA